MHTLRAENPKTPSRKHCAETAPDGLGITYRIGFNVGHELALSTGEEVTVLNTGL